MRSLSATAIIAAHDCAGTRCDCTASNHDRTNSGTAAGDAHATMKSSRRSGASPLKPRPCGGRPNATRKSASAAARSGEPGSWSLMKLEKATVWTTPPCSAQRRRAGGAVELVWFRMGRLVHPKRSRQSKRTSMVMLPDGSPWPRPPEARHLRGCGMSCQVRGPSCARR